jgi:hypothetical protein
VVLEWNEHHDVAIASVYEGENTEFVKDSSLIGNGGKQQVEVFFIDALWIKHNDSKKFLSIRAKTFEHQGGEQQFNGYCKAVVVFCLKHTHLTFFPLLGKPVVILVILMYNSG